MSDEPALVRTLLAQLRPSWQVRKVSWLAGGYSNSNYRVDTATHGSFVLRLPQPGVNPFGVDRQREQLLARWAAAHGLGLMPEYFDANTGVQLSRFVSTGAVGDLPRPHWPDPALIGRGLQRLHATAAPPDGSVGEPSVGLPTRLWDWAERCRLLGSAVPAALIEDIQHWRQRWSPTCICHQDLNPWNILVTDQHMLLLDWELAGYGDPRFDLANTIVLFDYNAAEVERFLAAAGYPEPATELSAWLRLVRIREFLWARLALAAGKVRAEIQAQHEQRGAELGLM